MTSITVKSGDNLWKIAKEQGITNNSEIANYVNSIIAENPALAGDSGNKIKAGQVINLPENSVFTKKQPQPELKEEKIKPVTQLQKDIPNSKLEDVQKKALLESKSGETTNFNGISIAHNNKGKTIWTTDKSKSKTNDNYYTKDGSYSISTDNKTKQKTFVEYKDKNGVTYDYLDSDGNGSMDLLKKSNEPNVDYLKSDQKSANYDIRKVFVDPRTTRTEKYNPETGQYEEIKSAWDRFKENTEDLTKNCKPHSNKQ